MASLKACVFGPEHFKLMRSYCPKKLKSSLNFWFV